MEVEVFHPHGWARRGTSRRLDFSRKKPSVPNGRRKVLPIFVPEIIAGQKCAVNFIDKKVKDL
jgi:hypothetical protein